MPLQQWILLIAGLVVFFVGVCLMAYAALAKRAHAEAKAKEGRRRSRRHHPGGDGSGPRPDVASSSRCRDLLRPCRETTFAPNVRTRPHGLRAST